MILVDTSVWSDFFRGTGNIFDRGLYRLIKEGANLAVSGIIYQEILQGIGSDAEFNQVEKYLKEFDYLYLNEPSVFRRATDIYRTCRRTGRAIRKPVDCLIAAQAMESRVELFHHDRDFSAIASVFPLKIFDFPSD